MKHKFLTIIVLCITLLCCIAGLTACGENPQGENGNNGGNDTVIETPDDTDTPAVDENPQGLDFYLLSDGTYAVEAGKAKYLEEIVIPATYNGKAVTSIGNDAFYNCSSLKSITIPDSITSIGELAFVACNSLTKVNYTGKIDGWCEINFADDGYGNPLNNENTLLYINDKLVTEANITTATKINAGAFYSCKALTSVTIGNSVTSIGDAAFYNCSSLTSVTIPDSVTSIGRNAFSDCGSLTSVTIPDGVTSIGYGAFRGCSKLQYNEYDNAYYLGNETNPYVVLMKVKSTDISSCTINENTKVIYNNAFYGCRSLTSITIPDSVTSIEYAAFMYCSSLTSITIPDSVTSIEGYAFHFCSSLTSATIGNSVTFLGGQSFEGCRKLNDFYYNGTAEEWQAIEKHLFKYPIEDHNPSPYVVHCSDMDLITNQN